MSAPDREDMAELLAVFLDEAGHVEREWEYTRAHDAADAFRADHPEAPATLTRATMKSLHEFEAQCPAHLRDFWAGVYKP